MKKCWLDFQEKERSEKVFLFAMVVVIFLGLLFRVRHYLAGRSLWFDEAMLALNVMRLSFVELTQQPLLYEQGAPIGFLFFLKVTTLIFGDSEYSFRLFSFLTGIASVGIFAFFAIKYLRKAGALFALTLFTSSPFVIYYSAEVKQYMGDIFAVLFMLLLYIWLLNAPYTNSRMIVFTLAASILLWTSHASVFVVTAVGVSLLWHYHQKKNIQAFWRTFAGLSIAGANSLLVYWINIRPLAESEFLASFWNEAYMPLPPTVSWAFGTMNALLQKPFGLKITPLLAFALIFIGAFRLWREKRQLALPILLTLLLTLIAGALQKYPLAERMLLFWTPLFFLLFGAALDALYSILRPRLIAILASSLLIVSILFFPTQEAFARLQKPLYREHIRPAMTHLRDSYQEGDFLYLYYFSEPAFLFYAPKYGLDDMPYVIGENHQGEPELYQSEINDLKIHGRTWLLFTHVYEVASINEEYYITNYLDQIAERKRLFRYPGSSVSLYLYFFPD